MEKNRAGHYARFAAHAVSRGGHLPAALRLAASVRPFTATRLRFATRLAVWPFHLALAQERDYNPLVLDQGPLQVTWCVLLEGTLRDETLLQDAVSKLIASAGFSFVLVYVDVTPEVAADRIEARGPMFRPFHKGRSRNVELLRRYRRQLERVLEVAEASSGTPALRVDGSRPLDENTARIEAFVDRLLLGAQAGT